ncbi:TNF receptor-associated factor homolog 1a isoform X3 [Gossypium hirsutum]|uniref:TNF receptor-associated factor homolog 1a isoform X3 n=1 Tax=Gossypium hirsutum TaxID=3635 RepID=A0ABM3C3A2_GOSHI|nr:TNF receptor-associated factor homolog 1a-like isoform X3 [Gossypium hirsutum]
MTGIVSEESGGDRSVEGISNGQCFQSGEALAEWRSSEQVENGTPSTSPPYWDSDDDYDSGLKPSELYGKYTWKIEKFSQINKRELRSNAFDIGGYKWYILIYPQGCDVCNHLSLFLCVANHDKLLPGWSHFAQFTIAVVNKDPKKSKYSDTLHRFWKKEHDWGWKKFMELSKLYDGFIESDTLIIKAQVQVVREKVDRPFRCLDRQYRRELVRVYLTNVEQICCRFLDDRRNKLGSLIEDKATWSSFCAFWFGIDQSTRCRMSREKTDVILKVVVKHFFIEKEVTSTLVMDSLYSGLKALEVQSKGNKTKSKLLDAEEMPAPIVHVEKDMFVLVDDVLVLLERAAALEPLPPKDEKGPQNRSKDGNSGGDFNKDSIERDERRLTELGRRTVEIFILSHIFSYKIEVAYQEAVAWKRQEELIREEAAWLAESEQKAKRGASEKEKKSKKKQAKQKRNNRKSKDKGREEKAFVAAKEKHQEDNRDNEKDASMMVEVRLVPEKSYLPDDVSDVSEAVDCGIEALQPDSEDRCASPVGWDTDTSEVHPPTEASSSGISSLSCMQNEVADKRSPSTMDDSSSTCSTDSVPSVVTNVSYKGNLYSNNQNKKSPSRGKNQRSKTSSDDGSWTTETDNQTPSPALDGGDCNDASESSKAGESESEAALSSSLDQTTWDDQDALKKEVILLQKKPSTHDPVDLERPKVKTVAIPSSPRNLLPTAKFRSDYSIAGNVGSVLVRKASSNDLRQSGQPASSKTSIQMTSIPKSEIQKAATSKPAENPVTPQVPVMSSPSSAPQISSLRPTAPVVSMVQTTAVLSRSVSAAGCLGPSTTPATSCVPQSYRNALGNHVAPGSSHPKFSSSVAYSQPPALVPAPVYIPRSSERMDPNSVQPGFPFGMVIRDCLPNAPGWMESSQRDATTSMHSIPSSLLEIENLDLSTDFPGCTTGRQTQGVFADEFPHLDIINDLLDEEHNVGRVARSATRFHSLGLLNRHVSSPSNLGMLGETVSSCGFEQAWSYWNNGFQQGYRNSLGNHCDTSREYIPQPSPLPNADGLIDGLTPTHWPMASLGMRNADAVSYPFYGREYSNLVCGVNGYSVFRPSDGL